MRAASAPKYTTSSNEAAGSAAGSCIRSTATAALPAGSVVVASAASSAASCASPETTAVTTAGGTAATSSASPSTACPGSATTSSRPFGASVARSRVAYAASTHAHGSRSATADPLGSSPTGMRNRSPVPGSRIIRSSSRTYSCIPPSKSYPKAALDPGVGRWR